MLRVNHGVLDKGLGTDGKAREGSGMHGLGLFHMGRATMKPRAKLQ